MNTNTIKKTTYHQEGVQQTGWSFWENYRPVEKESKGKPTTEKWDANLGEVFSFKDLDYFAKFWNQAPYNDSSKLLYNPFENTEKRIKRDEKLFSIDGLNLFREGIQPAWEDKANEKGYHLQVEQQCNMEGDATRLFKDLWTDLVFGLQSEDAENSESITGMRFMYKANKHSVRVELWIRNPLPSEKNVLVKGENLENINDPDLKVYKGLEKYLRLRIRAYRPDDKIKITDATHIQH